MAQMFMRSYEFFAQNPKPISDLVRFLDPTALYTLAAPSTPDAAREEVMTRVQQGEVIPPKGVKDIVHRHKLEKKRAEGQWPKPSPPVVQPLPKPKWAEWQAHVKHIQKIQRVADLLRQLDEVLDAEFDYAAFARAAPSPEEAEEMGAIVASLFPRLKVLWAGLTHGPDEARRYVLLAQSGHFTPLSEPTLSRPEPVQQKLAEELANEEVAAVTPAAVSNGEWSARGARIQAERKAKGWKVKELAMMANVTPSSISMAELGTLNRHNSPVAGRPAYSKLEAALGIGVEQL